jgi:hypothetical protein
MLQAKTAESEIPKIKFGTHLLESDVREILNLGQLQLNLTGQIPDFVQNLFGLLVGQLVLGRRWRLETMLIASILNGFPYDRMGIKFTGTFNRATDTIITPSPAWTDATNGLPLTNIGYVLDYFNIRYGKRLNRWLGSRQAFDTMVATDQFRDQSRFHIASLFNTGELPILSRDQNIQVFQRMFPQIEEVVFYDAHYRWEDDAGLRYIQRLLPLNAVILDSTQNDNNRDVRYLGNAPVTESAFINRVGAQPMGENTGNIFGGMQRGPYYYTTVPHDLNPPQIDAWAVQHAWPILREPNNCAVGGPRGRRPGKGEPRGRTVDRGTTGGPGPAVYCPRPGPADPRGQPHSGPGHRQGGDRGGSAGRPGQGDDAGGHGSPGGRG